MINMPPKHAELSPARSGDRKLTPKERGCFQCSRRRIICDKAEPSCGKCIKKGIECSGVNRIRFTAGVARRGRLKDCKIPNISNDAAINLPTTTAFPKVRWLDARKRETTPKKEVDARDEGIPVQDLYVDLEQDVEDIVRSDNQTLQHFSTHTILQPWLAPVTSETRMLFSYFSDVIAPVMVVLDTASNGYREIILRMALENDVLCRAVCVVAAQHLSRHRPEVHDAAETSHALVISHLRKQSLSALEDQVFNQSTWATLIVLLVGETVTGSPTCGYLVRMLLCLAENSRSRNEDSPVAQFLQAQTNMFELLGLPLQGEHSGISAIQKSFLKWQSFLVNEPHVNDEQSRRTIDQVRQCFDDACSIYIRCATSLDAARARPEYHDAQLSTIRNLITRLSGIPPHAEGAHALVWPCFVAGAEASDLEHRAFFVEYMKSIYAKTKFRNIPIAVQSLENLWMIMGDMRWTQCLPEISNVLVM